MATLQHGYGYTCIALRDFTASTVVRKVYTLDGMISALRQVVSTFHFCSSLFSTHFLTAPTAVVAFNAK